MLRLLFVTAILCALAPRADAMIKLCMPPTVLVPEDPSLVVSKADLSRVRPTLADGTAVPFTVRRLTDYHVWVTLALKHGAELSAPWVEGPWCAQFRRIRVSKDYVADRAMPAVAAITLGSRLGITLATHPTAWVQTEWAYTREELEVGRVGVSIDGLGTTRAWYGMILPPGRAPRGLYLKISLLFPDGRTSVAWTGWLDVDGSFGAGLRKRFAARPPPAAVCASGLPWRVPDARFIVDAAGERYRVVGRQRRRVPAHITHEGTTEGHQLTVEVAPRSAFWLEALPLGGACHGPFELSPKRSELRAVVTGRPAEYGEDPLVPVGIELPLVAPTLYWKLRLEWSLTPWDHAITIGSSIVRGDTLPSLAYDEQVPRNTWPIFVRMTPLFADGSEGPRWRGRLARDPRTQLLELVAD